MTDRRFVDMLCDMYYGWSDVALMTYKVGKVNVAVYYSAKTAGDELRSYKKPPYLIQITTLGRYPRVVKSERMSTLNDALQWLIEEFRPEYERPEETTTSEELWEEEMVLAGI